VLGFGASGRVKRTPVIFLHGNNDTPSRHPAIALGKVHDLAQAFVDRGYSPSEIWGLGLPGRPVRPGRIATNRSAAAHTTAANVDDLARFVKAVLAYTGAKRVDIVGHSLGGTLAREWMRRDDAYHVVRHLVTIALAAPRDHRLLAVAAELLRAGRSRWVQPEQCDLRRARGGRYAVSDAAEPRGDAWADEVPGAEERGCRFRLHLGAGRAVLPGCAGAGPERKPARFLGTVLRFAGKRATNVA
jgi:pimeloyl-ACP methyl ester carboxylesterase